MVYGVAGKIGVVNDRQFRCLFAPSDGTSVLPVRPTLDLFTRQT